MSALPPLPFVHHGFQSEELRLKFALRESRKAEYVDELIALGADGAYIVKALFNLEHPPPWAMVSTEEEHP